MRVKLQFEHPLPNIRSWYAIEENSLRHATVKDLLSTIASDFQIPMANATISLEGFPIPLVAQTKSLIRDGDTLILSGNTYSEAVQVETAKRKAEENINALLPTKKLNYSEFSAVNIEPEDNQKDAQKISDSGNTSEGDSSSSSSSTSETSSDSDSGSDQSASTSSSSDDSTISSKSIPKETTSKNIVQRKISIPSSLNKSKRNAVKKMMSFPASHYHFDPEEDYDSTEPIFDSNGAPMKNPPKVIYTEARLYNLKGTFTKGQEKRMAQRNKQEAELQESPQESIKEKEKPSEKNEQKDYSKYHPILTPKENIHIAFKTMELSRLYTPEISNYKEAYIIKVETSGRNRFSVTLKILPTTVLPVKVDDTWGAKPRGIIPTEGKLEFRDEDDNDELILPSEEIIQEEWENLIEPLYIGKVYE